MSGFLLDTNVVSEYTRPRPHPAIADFLATQDDLWVSVVVIHELEYGIAILSEGRRRARLRSAVSRFLEDYRDRIAPIDRRASEVAASLRARARSNGRALHILDALIAGTAVVCDLILVTRNVRDFAALDVSIVNPWEMP